MKIKGVEVTKKEVLELVNANEDIKSELVGSDKQELTGEAVNEFLDTDEGKKLLQPRVDQAVTKGIKTFKDNNIDKFKKEGAKEIEEQLQKKLEETEQKYKQTTINSKLQKQLLSSGLNPKKVDLAMKLADADKLSLDGDNLLGATDLIKGLEEQTPEWFAEPETPKGKGNVGAGQDTQAAGEDTGDVGMDSFRAAAGLE